jgi:hypothetical protein
MQQCVSNLRNKFEVIDEIFRTTEVMDVSGVDEYEWVTDISHTTEVNRRLSGVDEYEVIEDVLRSTEVNRELSGVSAISHVDYNTSDSLSRCMEVDSMHRSLTHHSVFAMSCVVKAEGESS